MSYWDILGINKTLDENEIKSAYRNQLKKVNPEDDQEGFMRLREAYEAAMASIKNKNHDIMFDDSFGEENNIRYYIDTNFSEVDEWMQRVIKTYEDFYQRIDVSIWDELLSDPVCFQLDLAEEARTVLLNYLYNHLKLPNRIWEMIKNRFNIEEDAQYLMEKHPEELITFILTINTYKEIIDYSSFSGEDDFDQYIDLYLKIKYSLDSQMLQSIDELMDQIDAFNINHPYLAVEKARYALLKNEEDKALEYIEEIVFLYDELEYVQYYYAKILAAKNRYDEAFEVIEQALILDSNYFQAKICKAEIMSELGKYEEAKELLLDLVDEDGQDDVILAIMQKINIHIMPKLKKIIEQNPDDYKHILDLGWCYCQNEMYDDGLKLIDHLTVDDANMYDYVNLKARLLLGLSRFDDSLPLMLRWRESILKCIDDGSKIMRRRINRLGYANYAIANCFAEKKEPDLEKALEYLEYAIQTEKNHELLLSCYYSKADIYSRKGLFDDSIDQCDNILDMDQRFYPAYVLKQENYLKLGMPMESIQEHFNALSLFDKEPRTYELAAEAFILIEKYDRALQVFEQAKVNELNSKALDILWLRLDICKVDHNNFQQIKDIENNHYKLKLDELNSRDKILFLDNLSMILDIYDENIFEFYKNAIDIANFIANQNEHYPNIFRRVAFIYKEIAFVTADRKIYEDALCAINHQIKLESSLYDFIFRGQIYLQLVRNAEAKKDFEKALDLYPDSEDVYMAFGDLYRNERKFQAAINEYKKALSQMKKCKQIRPLVFENIAQCYEQLRQDNDARRWYEYAIELFPERYVLIEKYAEFLCRIKEYEASITMFEGLYNISQDNILNIKHQVARVYERFDLNEAIDEYISMIQESIHSAETIIGLARCYFIKLNFEMSLEYAIDSLKMYQVHPEYYSVDIYREILFMIAMSLYLNKKQNQAKIYIDEILDTYQKQYSNFSEDDTIVGLDKHSYYQIGTVFAVAGNITKAKQYFEALKNPCDNCEYCVYPICVEYYMGSAILAYYEGNVEECIRLFKYAMQYDTQQIEGQIALKLLLG